MALALELRPADPQGAEALALLRLAALEARSLYPELHRPGAPWPGNVPTPPGGTYLLAWSGGEAVGMGAHYPARGMGSDGSGGWSEVRRVYVHPEMRRRGVARALMLALQAHARSQGLSALRLETGIRQAAALGLYESLGYRRIAGFGPYQDDPFSVCFEIDLD